MSYITIDADCVLDQLDDHELLSEVKERGLDDSSLEGVRKEDLVRAVAAQDWQEVDYLLRTYFLRKELQIIPPPRRVAQRLGRAA